MSVLEAVTRGRLVPVVVVDRADDAQALGDALVAGGLPVAEVTLRTDAALDVLRALAARGDLLVGAGTVLRREQVDAAVDAGAGFVVSPGLSREVLERAAERGVDALPGVATATEVQTALALGAGTVKLFPAEVVGGPRAVAALAAPFPHARFVPTGGIGPANLAAYLALPAVAAVGGSWMVPRALLAAHDTARLAALVAEAVALVAAADGRVEP